MKKRCFMCKKMLDESIDSIIRSVLMEYVIIPLRENSNDRRINKLISNYFPAASFDKIRKYRADFLNLVPNARARIERWFYVVLKWYLDGDIPKKELHCLNNFLGWLSKNNIQDEEINNTDWSGLSFSRIKQVYDEFLQKPQQNTNGNISYDKVKNINGFTVRRIDNEDEANRIGWEFFHGEWCIFDSFDEMVGESDGIVYIISNDRTYKKAKPTPIKSVIDTLHKLGKDNMADEIDAYMKNMGEDDIFMSYIKLSEIISDMEGYFEIAKSNGLPPYDEYGLSAIAITVYDDGMGGGYTRYNLPNDCDGFLDENELSQLIGVDINKVCPYVSNENITEQRIRRNIIDRTVRRVLREHISKAVRT